MTSTNRTRLVSRSRTIMFAALAVAIGCTGPKAPEQRAASGHNSRSTTTASGPPPGTLPPLVSPARSTVAKFTGEASELERAFRRRIDAFNAGDPDTVVELSADPEPSLREETRVFSLNYEIRLFRINRITVEGDRATVDYEDAIVGRGVRSTVTTLLGQRDEWVSDDGAWKWRSGMAVTPGIPEDLVAVEVTLPDRAPISISPIPDADFAFLLVNNGSAKKGVFVVGIADDADPASVVATIGSMNRSSSAQPMPEGVLELGATPDIAAGDRGTMVFNGRLPTGRYLLISRTASDLDPGGVVLPGEFQEFTVR